jgi:hypothetical protein
VAKINKSGGSGGRLAHSRLELCLADRAVRGGPAVAGLQRRGVSLGEGCVSMPCSLGRQLPAVIPSRPVLQAAPSSLHGSNAPCASRARSNRGPRPSKAFADMHSG